MRRLAEEVTASVADLGRRITHVPSRCVPRRSSPAREAASSPNRRTMPPSWRTRRSRCSRGSKVAVRSDSRRPRRAGGPSMRTLHLLRHAKSSWDDATIRDHDRPLAPRGARAARKIAEYLASASVHPALILCSSARRTVETLEALRPAISETAAVSIEPELYGADASEILELLRTVDPQIREVLVIATTRVSRISRSIWPATRMTSWWMRCERSSLPGRWRRSTCRSPGPPSVPATRT